ncbi:MAG: hypothetical protein K0Q74_1642 [Gammaproteobacteria bacterium]|jgi:hypothetical protein|nr:hypothetical protein [Gammaproteobacteria bacterium]
MHDSKDETAIVMAYDKPIEIPKAFWVTTIQRILGLLGLVASFYFPLAIFAATLLIKDFQEGRTLAQELWSKRERSLTVAIYLTTLLSFLTLATISAEIFLRIFFAISLLSFLPLMPVVAGVLLVVSNLLRGLSLLQSEEWQKYAGLDEHSERSWKNLLLSALALVFGFGLLEQASHQKKHVLISLGALAISMAIAGAISLILTAIPVFTTAKLSFLVEIGATLGLSGPLAIAIPVILAGVALGIIVAAIIAMTLDTSIKKQHPEQQNAEKDQERSQPPKQKSKEDKLTLDLLRKKNPLQKEELQKVLQLLKEKPIYRRSIKLNPGAQKLFLKAIDIRDKDALKFLLDHVLPIIKENDKKMPNEERLYLFLATHLFSAEQKGSHDISDFLVEWFSNCNDIGKNILWENAVFLMCAGHQYLYIVKLLLRHPDIQLPADTAYGLTSQLLIPTLIHAVILNEHEIAKYLIERCEVDVGAAIREASNKDYLLALNLGHEKTPLLLVEKLKSLASELRSQEANAAPLSQASANKEPIHSSPSLSADGQPNMKEEDKSPSATKQSRIFGSWGQPPAPEVMSGETSQVGGVNQINQVGKQTCAFG